MANRAERRRAERLGLALPATPTRCRIDLEGWDPENAKPVWADPRPEALQRVLIELAELLAQHVDDAAVVTLVIPLNLVEAVQKREPEVPYNLQSGSVSVGARTMAMPDGRIDVILNPGFLVALYESNAPTSKSERMQFIRRTAVHEAQHAVMQQRGSSYDDYDFDAAEAMFNRQVAASAAKLCDEHRAEWQAIRLTEPEPPTVKDVTDVLEALGGQLSAANQAYQASPEEPNAVQKLAAAVFTACDPFWTALGYWTAQHRTDDANITDTPAEIAALPLWQRYGGDAWSLLKNSLRTLPVEDLTTNPEVLNAAAQLVAANLTSSLETIGFRYEGTGADEAFYINRFDFPDK